LDNQAFHEELERAKKKIDAGAAFLITPPVFDVDRFGSIMEKVRTLGVPIIATVFLLKTVGIARYMSTYEPGAGISEQMIKRMRQASDREMEGIRIAGETVTALQNLAQGVKIVTLGWEHRLPTILECAGIA
jgi:5,10-methylenetetrahydrofolate reductase